MPDFNSLKVPLGAMQYKWKNRQDQLIDEIAALYAQLQDMDAYMQANSTWAPTSNPTIARSNNSVTATEVTTNNYNVAFGEAHVSYGADQWLLVRFPTANTGSATLALDALAAKTIKYRGKNLVAGTIQAGDLCLVRYDSANGWWEVVGFSASPSLFRGQQTGGQAAIVSATWTQIALTADYSPTHGSFATYRWTPPKGPTFMHGSVSLNTEADKSTYVAIYKNGVGIAYGRTISGASGYQTASAFWFDVANGTDYYDLYCYHDSATSKTITYADFGGLSLT